MSSTLSELLMKTVRWLPRPSRVKRRTTPMFVVDKYLLYNPVAMAVFSAGSFITALGLLAYGNLVLASVVLVTATAFAGLAELERHEPVEVVRCE